MKIIIVNGYSSTAAGNDMFKRFVVIVKKAFECIRTYGMEEASFVILDRKNIDTYIYMDNKKRDNTEARRLFDSTDIILMDGDANLLPWTKPAAKFSIFFKQCKQCNKALFAAGFAFYMLIYYCATNFSPIKILNGNGWGSKLEELHKFPTEGLPSGAGFLDNETGDIYTYNNNNNSWVPSANTGLHYIRNAASAVIGQFVQNVKVYRGKIGIRSINDTYKSNENEAICFVKKSSVQHWALLGLPKKFLVLEKNAWDSHPVNVTQADIVGSNYHTLADNERGPNIIEHKNTLATLFHVNPKYPETVQILTNFAIHIVNLIRVLLYLSIRVMEELIILWSLQR